MDPGRTLTPAARLTVSVTTVWDVTVAELAGDLGLAAAPALRDQLAGLLDGSRGRLVIDLSAVTACDPSGLTVLVGAARRARQFGGSLCLAAVPPLVADVLHRTGLERHFEMFRTPQAAVGARLPGPAGLSAARP
jgi:anti-anti-sigma factor